MGQILSQIKELDIAARAEVYGRDIARVRVVVLPLTIFVCLLAIFSEASHSETVLIRWMAVVAFVSTTILFSPWRFKLYGVAILWLAFGVCRFFSDDYTHHSWDSFFRLGMPLFFASFAYTWAQKAYYYARANSDSFLTEKTKVEQWLANLERNDRDDQVVVFNAGSFWVGYWTYAAMRVEGYWALARFKRSNWNSLAEFRILHSTALAFEPLPSGDFQVWLNGKPIPHASLPPDTVHRLRFI